MTGLRPDWRWISAIIAMAVVAVFVAANAHLIWVAFQSQPVCVPHDRTPGEGQAYGAAQSAC